MARGVRGFVSSGTSAGLRLGDERLEELPLLVGRGRTFLSMDIGVSGRCDEQVEAASYHFSDTL
jgi:hypothetical protein